MMKKLLFGLIALLFMASSCRQTIERKLALLLIQLLLRPVMVFFITFQAVPMILIKLLWLLNRQ